MSNNEKMRRETDFSPSLFGYMREKNMKQSNVLFFTLGRRKGEISFFLPSASLLIIQWKRRTNFLFCRFFMVHIELTPPWLSFPFSFFFVVRDQGPQDLKDPSQLLNNERKMKQLECKAKSEKGKIGERDWVVDSNINNF